MTAGGPPLRDAFTSSNAKRQYVRRLFSTIADRYDLITVLLSFGLDQRWKRRLVSLAEPVAGRRALDLACGTGDIAFALSSRGASVTGLDVTHRMLQIARSRIPDAGPRGPGLVRADMTALPFPPASFDIVTTGYGLRNVPDLDTALQEIQRVLRAGGVCVSLDFNRPEHPLVRGVFLAYLTAVGSVLGWLLHRDPDTYRYIPASIRRYPGARAITALFRRHGFSESADLAVLGGLMTIHVARK